MESTIKSVRASSTLLPLSKYLAFFNSSIVCPCNKAISEMFFANFWKSGFLETKSVSEFISTNAAASVFIDTAITPSAATLADFFSAPDIPFFLNQSIDS